MAYCTLDEIRKMLPEQTMVQLTDDEYVKPVTIDPADPACIAIIGRIDESIAAADAIIDGYCSTRYSVPFSPVPSLINKYSIELAIYYLYSRRTIPEDIKDRYTSVIARLKEIGKGDFSLGVTPEPDTSAVAGNYGESNKPVNDRVFTRPKLGGF